MGLRQEWLQNIPTALVHRNADHGETLGTVCSLEFGKPGDLLFASGAPRGPEIKENDFAAEFLQFYRFAGTVFQRKLCGSLSVIRRLQDRPDRRLISST